MPKDINCQDKVNCTSNTAPLAEITDCCLGDTGSFVMSQLECNCSAGAAADTTEK